MRTASLKMAEADAVGKPRDSDCFARGTELRCGQFLPNIVQSAGGVYASDQENAAWIDAGAGVLLGGQRATHRQIRSDPRRFGRGPRDASDQRGDRSSAETFADR